MTLIILKQTLIKLILRSMSENTKTVNRTVSNRGSDRDKTNKSVRTLQHLAVFIIKNSRG